MSDEDQLGNVDQRKLVEAPQHHEVEWTEIGEAEVTVDMFGHAKVHVVRKHGDARRNWIIAAACATLIVVAVAIYLWQGHEEPVAPAADLAVMPVASAVVEPAISAVVASAVPAPAPAAKPQVAAPQRVAPPAAVVRKAEVIKTSPVTTVKPAEVPAVTPKAVAAPAQLVSPILPAEPVLAPAKPQGEITY